MNRKNLWVIGLLMIVLGVLLLFVSDAKACTRCGIFGRGCRLQHQQHHAVVAAVVRSPDLLVVQNNFQGPNGQAALLSQQGGSVYGLQGAAQAYVLDPAAVLRQAADLARGAQSLAQVGLDGYNQSAGLALQLNASVQEPLARGTAAAMVLNAAGLNQQALTSNQQSLRITRGPDGRWSVEPASQEVTAAVRANLDTQQPAGPAPDPTQLGQLVAARCAQCHGLEKAEPAAGLYLDRGQAIDCRQSLKAIQAVLSGKMPKGQQVSAEERTTLARELAELAAVAPE